MVLSDGYTRRPQFLMVRTDATGTTEMAYHRARGFTCFLGGLSWEGFGVFVQMIVALELYKFYTTYTEQHLKEYLLWLVMFVPWLYFISPTYRSGTGSQHMSPT